MVVIVGDCYVKEYCCRWSKSKSWDLTSRLKSFGHLINYQTDKVNSVAHAVLLPWAGYTFMFHLYYTPIKPSNHRIMSSSIQVEAWRWGNKITAVHNLSFKPLSLFLLSLNTVILLSFYLALIWPLLIPHLAATLEPLLSPYLART